MHWMGISIEVPGEYTEPVTHLFRKHSDGSVAVEMRAEFNPDEGETYTGDGLSKVTAYLPIDSTTKDRRNLIDVGLRLINYLCPLPPLIEREINEEEWRNQKFEPVRVGKHLIISTPGSDLSTSDEDIVIPLEPGLAFGTGHHPTTMMTLEILESLCLENKYILDAGCGSGILSIAALKLGAKSVTAIDVEADAIRASESNLIRAGVSEFSQVIKTSLPSSLVPSGYFDLVMANISAKVLMDLSSHLLDTLRPNGILIGSGVLETRWLEVKECFEEKGGMVNDARCKDEWMCFLVKI